jgi:hypothetical protein
MREEVVLARTDQGDGLTRVMVEYVTPSWTIPPFNPPPHPCGDRVSGLLVLGETHLFE